MSASMKRRRTSPDTYVAINGSDHTGQGSINTSTPKRASYLSPTKASLARSNPQLLQISASAKKNRESEPSRRQSLLDAVLGNRSLVSTDEQPAGQSSENVTTTEMMATEAVSSTRPNRPDLHQPDQEKGIPNTPRHREAKRSSEQGRQNSTPRTNGHSTRFASPKIIPQLVDSPRRDSRRSTSAEMELPPTPVQLGKDKLPDRPRGLSSSSPSGRDKNRGTIRGGNVQSSPLKPREMAPIVSEDEDEEEDDIADNVEIASGLGEDERDDVSSPDDRMRPADMGAAGSDVEPSIAASGVQLAEQEIPTTFTTDVIEKTRIVRNLQSELQALQQESRKLQALSARLNTSHNIGLESLKEDFEIVLQTANHDDLTSVLPTDQSPLFQKHASSYLNLFADPALRMSYATWEKSLAGRPKFVYQTTFAASKPWPVGTFTLTLEIWIDWDTDVIENFVLSHQILQPELSKWFQSRRQDTVLRRDAATFLNGSRKFFEASVKRARIWLDLIEPQANTSGGVPELNDELSNYPVTSQKEACSLLPYLFKTQHGFALNDSVHKQTRRSLGSAKQLLLTYNISFDWLGQPDIETDILITGFNQETVEAAQQLYRQVEQVGGIVKALDSVRDILRMSANVAAIDGDQPKTMRTKKGKARRMTIFN